MSKPIFPPCAMAGQMASIVLRGQSGLLWRTYTLCSDNKIHQIAMNDPNTLQFVDNLIGGPTPMPNSPIAAVSWGVTNFQARLFYFTEDCKVQEMYYTQLLARSIPGWEVTSTIGDVVPGSVALYAQVAANGDNLEEVRVGYQSPSNPETITESYWVGVGPWKTRTYPKEMN
ncbi:hypothetical protein AZE42_10957 [Rhizopogon vesiculosus]|uniref:Fucose-specific lectin n=1 Tax=Rhizopogon vesiculosus TaxID=180088 RepID=A0A1J8Q471_9AGAM|nr:hypothetical protein AZE42_10957 [Rhizopogon vesiculosus]